MEILKIVGFALIALLLIITLGEQRKDIAVILSILAGTFILLFCVSKIQPVIELLNKLSEKSGINKEFFGVILKVTIIAYIVEIARSLCEDSKQHALGEKIELAGKVIIISISIPIITSLISLISDMMVLI
ncbi:MAG: stage III sporulation protein AD [Clostridia bacterium]|nr:stage III sporulation protein AD [Clostridia bacterium]